MHAHPTQACSKCAHWGRCTLALPPPSPPPPHVTCMTPPFSSPSDGYPQDEGLQQPPTTRPLPRQYKLTTLSEDCGDMMSVILGDMVRVVLGVLLTARVMGLGLT